MSIYIDQLNRKIKLTKKPSRIISLVPSQTELLFHLGLDSEIVGITKFCIHPKEWKECKTIVGGTKNVDFKKIETLRPDLIICNKEENEQTQIEELMKRYTVWISDINNLTKSFDMITRIGTLVGKPQESINLKLEIELKFNQFINQRRLIRPIKVAYLIWKNPYMVAGKDTFIDDMLMKCGFQNVFIKNASRYPVITQKEIIDARPKLILLSSEPYPFKEQHILELQAICPEANVLLVDGELFSWYGSRLLQSTAYFQDLLEKVE